MSLTGQSVGPQRTGVGERRPSRRIAVLKIAATALVLVVLIALLPARELLSNIRRIRPEAWSAALAAYLALHLIGVAKWRMLIGAAGAHLSWRNSARAYYWGLFGNLFLPSLVGGDVIRAGMALSHVKSRSGLLLGSLVDRMLDVIGLGLLAGLGALLSPRALDARSGWILGTFAALVGAIAVFSILMVAVFPVRRLPMRLRRILVRIRQAIRATRRHPEVLVIALLAGMALQSILVVMNWWLGRLVGIDIPMYVWFFVWPLAKISALVPITQGGIGVREAAQAALFAPFGVSAVQAVAVGLVFQTVLMSGALVGGGIAVLLGRIAARTEPAGDVMYRAGRA